MTTLTTSLSGIFEETSSAYALRFPQTDGNFSQDKEWCEIYESGHWRRIRLHDYAGIYNMPGLYEQIFTEHLHCVSPQTVVDLLAQVMTDWDQNACTLRILDLGAGNGMVGEQLRRLGVQSLVGTDILPDAAAAAERDRPALYDDYLVADFCDLTEDQEARFARARPNCLTSVAALGFGDIPPLAFANALRLVSTPAWVAFNIKETFLSGIDETGFSRFIRTLCDREILQIQAYRRYCHRLSISGKRLHYVAMVTRKLRPMPPELLESFSHD